VQPQGVARVVESQGVGQLGIDQTGCLAYLIPPCQRGYKWDSETTTNWFDRANSAAREEERRMAALTA
jgi:hypothetical protein